MRISKQLIIASFALLPILAFSQKRFAFDVRVSPDYTFRYIRSQNDNFVNFPKSYYDESEVGKFNGHVGINVTTELPSRIGFRIGLQFSKMGYSGTGRNGFHNAGRDKQGNLTVTDIQQSLVIDGHTTDYTFLNLPFACRFVFFKGSVSPYIELGIMPSYHIGGSTVYTLEKQQLTIKSDYPNLSLFAHGALGLRFKATESLQFFFQPTLQYVIGKTGKTLNPALVQHLYSIGVELGVSKAF
jgi:hypothetical protein